GAVRFYDAVLSLEGQRTYPAPASWQIEKDSIGATYHNFALASVRTETKGRQFKAKKGGWITADGTTATAETVYSLRTAVDSSGKAREGLLYGISALRAGTRMSGAIEGSEEDLKAVLDILLGAHLRLGRSRNQELGLVKVTRRQSPVKALADGAAESKTISFLCVSRCIFRDVATGAPRL
ncbi:unnamed protein product, partial [Phaeothamnion confervicola]